MADFPHREGVSLQRVYQAPLNLEKTGNICCPEPVRRKLVPISDTIGSQRGTSASYRVSKCKTKVI